MIEKKNIVEFGDFQTPVELATEVTNIIQNSTNNIGTIIEPTCGIGNILLAACNSNINSQYYVGWEINPEYVKKAKQNLINCNKNKILIHELNFFNIDWFTLEDKFIEPYLFLGNPPWVTNAQLGKLQSNNIPTKNNFLNHTGFDAITGKSNFDISEWMLIKIAEYISNTESAMAFLVKTSVARKVFSYIAKNNLLISHFFLRRFDAKKYFNVNVDACLFFAKGVPYKTNNYLCPIYSNMQTTIHSTKMGIVNNKIVSNIDVYNEFIDLDGTCEFTWRSGVKHDAALIMEFTESQDGLVNGLGEIVDIPFDYLYPMYKSSNISKESIENPNKWMLITQSKIGKDTNIIKSKSPKTWEYLVNHSSYFSNRKSSIYQNSPRFSMFGVGDYTFKPWKIAISGLYKNIQFSKIGTYMGKPIVLDDTCYSLGFNTLTETNFILELLTSNISIEFLSAIVFKDNKRPITISLLNRINFYSLSKRLGLEKKYLTIFHNKNTQIPLF